MKIEFLSLLGAVSALMLSGNAVFAQQEAGKAPPEIQLSEEGKKILCEKFPLNSRCPGGQPLTGGAPAGTEAAPAPDGTTPSDPSAAPAPDGSVPTDPSTAPAPDGTVPSDPGTAPPPAGSDPTTPGTAPATPGSPGMGQ